VATAGANCRAVATRPPVSWPSTAATPRRSCRCASWSVSPAAAWTIEETFQTGKGLTGLDEHQVRRWTSWRRWTLLAMIAHALLVVIAANEHTDRPEPTGMIPLTCSEIRRLLAALVDAPHRIPACPHTWSNWRRRHQHRARTSHYRRQETTRRRP
jgi:hypothetical protein